MDDRRGFSLIEMLTAMTIMLAVTAGIFSLGNPAHGMFQTQLEVADVQQRLRVGVDVLTNDLLMAGAGAYSGPRAGALGGFFAPILPYRQGDNPDLDDGDGVAFSDRITIFYVPPTLAETTLAVSMPADASQLPVHDVAGCPAGEALSCAFKAGMNVLIYDDSGAVDTMEITQVQDSTGSLEHNHRGPLSKSYDANAKIVQVAKKVYYYNAPTHQLLQYDGTVGGAGLPAVDNVVALAFVYWGDPQPPVLRKPGVDQTVTYGPKPPAPGITSGNYWPAGANCIIDASGAGDDQQQVARLATLGSATGALVKLDDPSNAATSLTDGPWCPDPDNSNRWDADLLRIRKISVTLRVQSAVTGLRGNDPLLFLNPGTSRGANSLAPDQAITFDITPRNLNLRR